VLDLGAHVGTFTRLAVNRGATKVVAVEAEPSHVAYLKHTFASEIQDGRVHIVEGAVWHAPGQLHFSTAGVTSQIVLEGGLTVRATTVDEVVADLKLDAVDFVKADIEGAERHMLKGASQTIARFAPRLALCIYHLPDDPVVIPQLAKTLKPYKAAMNIAHSQVFLWCESPDAT
jgi:FkbM family methyltransferase